MWEGPGPSGPESDPGSFLDADDVAEREVLHWVLHRDLCTHAVFLEVMVVAAGADLNPSGGGEDLNNFPAADHRVVPRSDICSIYN